jgi:hypothetical protein
VRLRRAVEGIRWYLREVSGEGDYDRYVAHAAATPSRHPSPDPPRLRTARDERAGGEPGGPLLLTNGKPHR